MDSLSENRQAGAHEKLCSEVGEFVRRWSKGEPTPADELRTYDELGRFIVDWVRHTPDRPSSVNI